MIRTRNRQGAILVAALVCLLVSLSLVSTMIAGTLHRRVQLKIERNARQATHLLIAGRDRARQQRNQDSNYTGETWQTAISDSATGEVCIEVTRRTNGLTKLAVTAIYPAGDPRAVQRSHIFYLPVRNSIEEESP